MKINGLLRLFKGVNGFRGDRPTERQWQPTNTAHDPNPPITLEDGGGGSPVNYALTCAVGSYAITGQAATLTVGRRMALDAGAYAVAGQAATLKVSRRLTLDAGAYTLTGNAATLTVNRRLALDAGAYTYAGQAAALTVARRLALDAGAYTYTGQAATLDYVPGAAGVVYTLDLAAGAYTIAGQNSDLTYTPGAPAAPPPIAYWDVMLGSSQTPTKKKQRKQELETMLLLLG